MPTMSSWHVFKRRDCRRSQATVQNLSRKHNHHGCWCDKPKLLRGLKRCVESEAGRSPFLTLLKIV